ncbi:MAG TPA: ROK family protein [Opitutaceae bacterium]|nr:ROK family protein [Opitutaceae bacterium]
MPSSRIKSKHQIVAGIEAELLKRVRVEGGKSRAELARELRLAPSTTGIYVDRLVREGFLIERDAAPLDTGRPPKQLEPNPAAGKFLGVDFEPQNLFAVAVDFSLHLVRRCHRAVPANEPVPGILRRIEEALQSVLEGDRRPLLSIGVAVPGSIDQAKGLASGSELISGWDNVPVGPRLAEKFKVPVRVQNNIRTMAMAELWLGQGRGLTNFVSLGIRTGIGTGVIANGQLLCGAQGGAGEVGLWPAPDAPATDGNRERTLETTSSLGAILQAASEAAGKPVDFDQFRAQAESGDRTVLAILKQAAEQHAVAIYQLHVLFDPERIIVVGPLAELGALYLAPLKSSVRRRCHRAPPELVASSFGQYGGALGAAAFALHEWLPSR